MCIRDSAYHQDLPLQIAGRLMYPILNYGRTKNNIRIEDATLQQTLVDYRHTVLRAAQEAEDGMAGFLRSQEAAGFMTNAVVGARRSVDLAFVQYRKPKSAAAAMTTVSTIAMRRTRDEDLVMVGHSGGVGSELMVFSAGGFDSRSPQSLRRRICSIVLSGRKDCPRRSSHPPPNAL